MDGKKHDEDLITEHESQLKKLNEDNILIKDSLGIKEKKNGKRDRQLKEAWKRITEVGDKAEEEDKTLNEKVTNMQLDLAEIKGYMKGSNERKEWSQKKIIVVTSGLVSLICTICYGLIIYFTPL